MKNVNYRTNSQLWSIEDTAAAAGYEKTSDCYWAQIFTNAETGDQFTATREESCTDDPAAELAEILDSTPAEYTETRTMSADALRALCIQKNWYTRGTCAEYDRLLRSCGLLRHLETADLARIAQDIVKHSNMPDGYDVPAVMFELARICAVCFDVAE